MSLTFNPSSGIPIAQLINIRSGEYKDIYITEEDEQSPEELNDLINELLDSGKSKEEIINILSSKPSKEIKARSDEQVLFLPSPQSERVFIAGRSGMGKSTIAKDYIVQYKEMYPKNDIFLISRHEEDPAYDSVIEDIKHVVVNEDILEHPVELEDFKDSLIIFDDVDNLQSIKVSKYVHQIVDDLISNGRKYNIYVLYLGHQLANYSKTRNITNEANKVFFFTGVAAYHTENFLKTKMGLDKNKIKKILDLKSRWVCLNVMRPYTIIHQYGVFVI